MFGLGMPEILLILAIALIVIGPQKLPEVAKTLGRAMGEFKRSAQDLKNSIDIETTVKDPKPKPVKTKLKDVIKDIGTQDTEPQPTDDPQTTSDKADDLKDKTSSETAQETPRETAQASTETDTATQASPKTETTTPKE